MIKMYYIIIEKYIQSISEIISFSLILSKICVYINKTQMIIIVVLFDKNYNEYFIFLIFFPLFISLNSYI